MLSDAQLREIMPRLSAAKLPTLLPALNAAMAEYAIDTPARVAAFVAQLAHESGEFRWMEEIWGPTDAQRRYEPQSTLASRLGNTQPGDGARFKGRGPIQLTGRANYQRFGQLLGVDLLAAPESASSPDIAFRIAALFWANRGLNALADSGDFREITRRINGGYNGFDDRLKYFERAKTVLADMLSKALPRGFNVPATVPEEELDRGVEAVRELAPATRRKAKKAATKKPRAKAATSRKARKTTKAKKAKRAKSATKARPARKAASRRTATKRKVAAKKKVATKKRTRAGATTAMRKDRRR